MTDQKTTGTYDKFYVERRDHRDHPGGDRTNADYFVLDLTYDKYAVFALREYAELVKAEYPLLAADLYKKIYHPEYPFIYKACFAVTLDNGGLNRDNDEPSIKDAYHTFIQSFAADNPGYDLEAINRFFKSLSKEEMEIATAGEETEMLALFQDSPEGAYTLLVYWFEAP